MNPKPFLLSLAGLLLVSWFQCPGCVTFKPATPQFLESLDKMADQRRRPSKRKVPVSNNRHHHHVASEGSDDNDGRRQKSQSTLAAVNKPPLKPGDAGAVQARRPLARSH